jgi:phosphoribosyl-ATP pyrophosphohydrolase/phosphoribosyl-AMP cyclohydrolase
MTGTEELKYDEKGLIPVIAQDINTNEVLMMAYTNKEALENTVKTGYMHYWSRSRKKLWMKGEESGNTQKIVSLYADCDLDSLLVKVEQKGPACHTGERSCFSNHLLGKKKRGADIMAELIEVLRDRKENPKPNSYTNLLLADLEMLWGKIREEADELCQASQGSTEHDLVHEAADVFYHTLVLLVAHNIDLEQVWEKLEQRRK